MLSTLIFIIFFIIIVLLLIQIIKGAIKITIFLAILFIIIIIAANYLPQKDIISYKPDFINFNLIKKTGATVFNFVKEKIIEENITINSTITKINSTINKVIK